MCHLIPVNAECIDRIEPSDTREHEVSSDPCECSVDVQCQEKALMWMQTFNEVLEAFLSDDLQSSCVALLHAHHDLDKQQQYWLDPESGQSR